MAPSYIVPGYLQRAELTPTPSELSRLNSDKLGIFTSETPGQPQPLSQQSYNPLTHSAEAQPKFYVYTVQRREIFEDDLEDPDEAPGGEGEGEGGWLENGELHSGNESREDEGVGSADDDDDEEGALNAKDKEEERRREAKVLALQRKVQKTPVNGHREPMNLPSQPQKQAQSLPSSPRGKAPPMASNTQGRTLGKRPSSFSHSGIFGLNFLFFFFFFLSFLN